MFLLCFYVSVSFPPAILCEPVVFTLWDIVQPLSFHSSPRPAPSHHFTSLPVLEDRSQKPSPDVELGKVTGGRWGGQAPAGMASCGCGSFGILCPERTMARPSESCCGKTISASHGALLLSVAEPEVMLVLKEATPLQLNRILWSWFPLAHFSLAIVGLGNGIWKIISLHEDKRSHMLAFSFVFSVFPLVYSPGGLLFCLLTFGES